MGGAARPNSPPPSTILGDDTAAPALLAAADMEGRAVADREVLAFIRRVRVTTQELDAVIQEARELRDAIAETVWRHAA